MNRTIGIISTNYAGTGLEELVNYRTPASVPFGGRYRMVDFSLSNMVNSGISSVGLITPRYYRSLLDHVGAGKGWDLDRKEGGLFVLPGSVYGFKEENSRFLFRDVIRNKVYFDRGDGDNVLFSAGDNIFNIDYLPMIEQHEMSGCPVTLLYKKTAPGENRRGHYLTVGEDGRVKSITWGTSGELLFLNSFIIDKSFMLRLIRDFSALEDMDLVTLLERNLGTVRMGAYEHKGYVGCTDTTADYMRTSMDLLKSEVRADLFPRARLVRTSAHDTPPALFLPGSRVTNSIVTAGSVVEGTVENSLVSRSARIEKGAVVRNCVLMDKCVVRAGAVLENVICDKKVTVSADMQIRGTAEKPCILPRSETI